MDRDPGRRNVILEFFRGVGYAFRGVWLVITRPVLWAYVVAPILVTAVLFAIGVAGILYVTEGWAPETAAPADPNAALAPLAEFVQNLLAYGLRVLFVLVFGVVVYFASSIVATPFNDAVSAQVETLRLGPYTKARGGFLGDTWMSFAHSSLSFVLWAATVGAGMALNLLPLYGTLAAALLSVVSTGWFIARESTDGVLSRRRLSYGHKLRIAQHHGAMFLGFGLVGASVVWIPFVNLLVVPFAIAGGTLMYCELEAAGRVPDANGSFGYTPEHPRNARKADPQWRAPRA
jgi:uncharacterized protein involved in cysteine biosynthesis